MKHKLNGSRRSSIFWEPCFFLVQKNAARDSVLSVEIVQGVEESKINLFNHSKSKHHNTRNNTMVNNKQ